MEIIYGREAGFPQKNETQNIQQETTNNSVGFENLHEDHTLNKTSAAGNKLRYPFKSRSEFYFL